MLMACSWHADYREVPKAKLASREEATERVYAFHASKYFARIEPIPGAVPALRHLQQSFELHVVTSRQTDIEAQTRGIRIEAPTPD